MPPSTRHTGQRPDAETHGASGATGADLRSDPELAPRPAEAGLGPDAGPDAEPDTALEPRAAVLDSQYFPHILDKIVVHAPYKALLGLRATSRDMKKRVDALLMYHTFRNYVGRSWGRNRPFWDNLFTKYNTDSEARRIPALYKYNVDHDDDDNNDDHGNCSRDGTSEDADDIDNRLTLLMKRFAEYERKRVGTEDVKGRFVNTELLSENKFGSTGTVDQDATRIYDVSGWDFMWVVESGHHRWIRTKDAWNYPITGREAPTHVHFGYLPYGQKYARLSFICTNPAATKIVVNVAHDCTDLATITGCRMYRVGPATSDARSLVKSVVFVRNPPDRPWACLADGRHPERGVQVEVHEGPEPTYETKTETDTATLVNALGDIAVKYWRIGHPRVTFVGFPLECLAPSLFNNRDNGDSGDNGDNGDDGDDDEHVPSTDDVREHLVRQLVQLYHTRRMHEYTRECTTAAEIEACIDQTDIVDHETYARRVGAEVYRIETVW